MKLFLAVFALFIAYTSIDIIAGLYNFFNDYSLYFVLWQFVLVLMMIFLARQFRSILVPLPLFFMAHTGVEDLFYYLLQLKLPPPILPWLTNPLTQPQPATPISLMLGCLWSFALLAFVSIYHSKALEANSKLGTP